MPELHLHDCSVSWQSWHEQGMYWAVYDVPENRITEWLYPLARAIAEFIEAHRELWMRRLLRQQFDYLSSEERLWVLGRALQILDNRENTSQRRRVDLMAISIMLFVAEHQTVIIEGIQDFLMPAIRDEMLAVLGEAVDDYFLEREHREYIRFLRQFSERQMSIRAVVHVTYPDLRITDERGRSVATGLIEQLQDGLPLDQDLADELLLSALVLLAPGQIVLHGNFPHDLDHTIRDVFPGRVRRISELPNESQTVELTGSKDSYKVKVLYKQSR
ncbi:sporulation protein YtxC [Sulfobacillus thermosulfidooxidans]|uniref:sporulation protein YtxC n=1 Tax=Sulfobacillus thermosulfidooxidans TaxID=28034 RepID=UPI0002FC5A41|nr:sporulation protein YtxC [Sulfobacillus thermosulfidooxidans]